jgi:hypothetical protein
LIGKEKQGFPGICIYVGRLPGRDTLPGITLQSTLGVVSKLKVYFSFHNFLKKTAYSAKLKRSMANFSENTFILIRKSFETELFMDR